MVRVHDLELEIEVLREVNAHLNGHVEKTTYQIDSLTAELNAWKKRAKVLTRALDAMKRGKDDKSELDGEELLSSIFRGLEDTQVKEDEIEAICQVMGEDGASSAIDLEGIDLTGLMSRGKTEGWLVDVDQVKQERHPR